MRRLHLALFAALIGMGSSSGYGRHPATVTGLVSDSAGVPQIGAVVRTAAARHDGDRHRLYQLQGPVLVRLRSSWKIRRQGDGHVVPALAAGECPRPHQHGRQSHAQYSLRSDAVAAGGAARRHRQAGRLGVDPALGGQSAIAALARRRTPGGGFRQGRRPSQAQGAA